MDPPLPSCITNNMLLILLTLPSRDLVWTVSVFQYDHNNNLGWHSNNTRGPLVYKLQLLPPIINQSCYSWCLVHNYTAILSASENEIFLKLCRTLLKSMSFDFRFIDTTEYIFKINHMWLAFPKKFVLTVSVPENVQVFCFLTL